MPVTKNFIKPQIIKALEQSKTKGAEEGTEFLAEELSKIIVDAIQTAEVQPGISVTGSSPSGPVQGSTTSFGKIK